MTAKRFISRADYDWWFVKDTTGKFKGKYDDWMGDEEVIDLLNALHEENEKLKQENKELEKFRYSVFQKMNELIL